MRVKLEWLNEFVDLTGLNIKEIVKRVGLYSIEVEGVEQMIHASNVVIGYVLTKTPHPDSNHLNLLTVDVKDEVLNIVCGASNVDKGQYVIVAKPGCLLDGPLEIKKSKIRGQESCGMVCSLQELGLDKKYVDEKFVNGIYYFEDKVEIGTEGAAALNLADPVIELGLTPNRGDMLSLLGVAYEFSAVFKRPLKKIYFDLIREEATKSDKLDISIKTNGCKAYYGQVIKNVVIKPSPRWLFSRLIAFGIRPINNCVDITNYIMALYGQPMHAFDLDELGSKIVVRNAFENETMITLDEQTRNLESYDVVITNGTSPNCLGGVMGGLQSEVTKNTKNIMLEAAVFDSNRVRKTAARLNLHSESSNRFERGVDINRTKMALDHACYLFQTLADANIIGEAVLAGDTNIKLIELNVTKEEVNKLLGTSIETKEIVEILNDLAFNVNEKNGKIKVQIPSRRPDIIIKEDLIEEIGRLYGYDLLPSTKPVDSHVGTLSAIQQKSRLIKKTLNALGLDEVITYSLVTEEQNNTFPLNDLESMQEIKIMMPITEERKVLRTKLMPSILEVVKYNYARKNKNLAIYELGKIYYIENNDYQNKKEKIVLSGALSHEFSNTSWNGKIEKVDFYLVKGIIAELFNVLDLEIDYKPLSKKSMQLHPTRTAELYIDNKVIGYIGQLHPQFALNNDLDGVYVFEILMDEILEKQKDIVKYMPVSKIPSIERDIALVMDKNITAQEVVDCIKKSDKQLLKEVHIFDLYEGEKVLDTQKSLAIKLIFTSNEAMTDEIINGKIKRILKDLQFKLNIELRQ